MSHTGADPLQHRPFALDGYAHGRVPRDVRLRQVLGLAEALFVERGYQGTSMDELARRAGVSKPVIYALVGSKEELFRACIGRAADELAAEVASAVAGQEDWAERLRAGGLAFFRFVAAREGVFDALLSGDAAAFVTEVAVIRRRQTELVAALLTDAVVATATSVEPLRIEASAHILNGAFEALAGWWKEHPDLTPEVLTDWLVELVQPGLERLTGT